MPGNASGVKENSRLSSGGSKETSRITDNPRQEFLGAGELWLECTPSPASLLPSSPSRSLLAQSIVPQSQVLLCPSCSTGK